MRNNGAILSAIQATVHISRMESHTLSSGQVEVTDRDLGRGTSESEQRRKSESERCKEEDCGRL